MGILRRATEYGERCSEGSTGRFATFRQPKYPQCKICGGLDGTRGSEILIWLQDERLPDLDGPGTDMLPLFDRSEASRLTG